MRSIGSTLRDSSTGANASARVSGSLHAGSGGCTGTVSTHSAAWCVDAECVHRAMAAARHVLAFLDGAESGGGAMALAAPNAPSARESAALRATAAVWPLCACLSRDAAAIETMAGRAARPPIARPVVLSDVHEVINNYTDACTALRRCADAAALLANQKETLKSTYSTRLAMIAHLFLRTMPLPLP
eukprot:5928113-Pleurochrysis_carterae.AAC.1